MIAIFFLTVIYFILAVVVKSYYKLYRYNDPLEIMKEEPYLIGLGWPIYLVYRLVAWPFVWGSHLIENKLKSLKNSKKEIKVRISDTSVDQELLDDAEQEVEEMLSKRNLS